MAVTYGCKIVARKLCAACTYIMLAGGKHYGEY